MGAEAQPGEPLPAGGYIDGQATAVPDIERAAVPPILTHFYGFCEANGLNIGSTDPQDGQRFAEGIREYLGQAIDSLNAARTADEHGTKQPVPRLPRHSISMRLLEFYAVHGAAVPKDSVLREHRAAYLERGVNIARGYKQRFPEIVLTEQFAGILSNNGHTLASDSTMILLAATGETIRGLSI